MNIIKKKPYTVFLYSIVGFSILANHIHTAVAAWSSHPQENTPVCTMPEQQGNPQMTSDGAGGAIITWEDRRNVHFDIYAQRIDAQGNMMWEKGGVPVCAAPENQIKPRMISDGAGGAIITWHDIRNGTDNADVYTQRIDAQGKPQWTINGITLCNEPNAQNSPIVTTDGAGGAIIIWQDYRTNYADLYAQRINNKGEAQWVNNGKPVCVVSGTQGNVVVINDGVGGAIFAWQDFRKNYADIYAQRIDGSGKILWDKYGVPVSTAIGHANFPVITSNGAEGAIIAWVDTRNGNNDIFAQQVDGNGAVQWRENGIPVCTSKGNQNLPVIASDNAGGALLAWWDVRTGESDVYAQHIDLTGKTLWKENGQAICVESGIQNYVSIASDGHGNAMLVWNDDRDRSFDVYAQFVDAKGVLKWKNNGVACCTAADNQGFPSFIIDDKDNAIITWQDSRYRDKSYWDIFAQKINGEGFLGE